MLMEEVVSPVLQMKLYAGAPAIAVAVNTTTFPEQIAGFDEVILTLKVHWLYDFKNTINNTITVKHLFMPNSL
jgi:hypothetical protein